MKTGCQLNLRTSHLQRMYYLFSYYEFWYHIVIISHASGRLDASLHSREPRLEKLQVHNLTR
jgi:hypothetical protein